MKNIIFTFLVFIGFFSSFGQNKLVRVQYKVQNPYHSNTAILIANQNNCIYRNGQDFKANKKQNTDGTYEIKTKENMGGEVLYAHRNSNIVYWTQHFNQKDLLVRDSLPDIKWNISSDTKMIGNFVCHKATTNFRGSRVIAWFTSDIPITFGSYKFRGLPGLILEVYNPDGPDVTKITAKHIQYPYKKEIDFKEPSKKQYELTSYEALIKAISKELNKQIKVGQTRLPKNAQISNQKSSRPGLEKKFEWEN